MAFVVGLQEINSSKINSQRSALDRRNHNALTQKWKEHPKGTKMQGIRHRPYWCTHNRLQTTVSTYPVRRSTEHRSSTGNRISPISPATYRLHSLLELPLSATQIYLSKHKSIRIHLGFDLNPNCMADSWLPEPKMTPKIIAIPSISPNCFFICTLSSFPGCRAATESAVGLPTSVLQGDCALLPFEDAVIVS